MHDAKSKFVVGMGGTVKMESPHRVLQHLDESILRTTKNVTQNSHLEETLNQISKDLVATITNKLEIQDKITRITREALDASGKSKGITAIETRRILDFISKTLSGHILSITKSSTEPELHRLVYGLAQIAAEVSIVSALDDITYTSALSKKQSIDISVKRKKRSTSQNNFTQMSIPPPKQPETPYEAILNKTNERKKFMEVTKNTKFEVLSYKEKKPVQTIKTSSNPMEIREKPLSFINQTAYSIETNQTQNMNDTPPQGIVLERHLNGTEFVIDTRNVEFHREDEDFNLDEEAHEFADGNFEEKTKAKLEKLENKAKKAILYAGDVAYLTAASVVAMRRALTASTEVQMSMKLAKTGMSHHQELMMNLARTAAQQAGKEAKSATSKSLACDRVIKMALKYTAQSRGAKLNHVANRIVMDTVSLATLAKSMAFVSSDIAINSLYEATDVKPPVT